MAAGSGSTHASRKPEGPRKFSSRTETKKIPDPFVSRFVSTPVNGVKPVYRTTNACRAAAEDMNIGTEMGTF